MKQADRPGVAPSPGTLTPNGSSPERPVRFSLTSQPLEEGRVAFAQIPEAVLDRQPEVREGQVTPG